MHTMTRALFALTSSIILHLFVVDAMPEGSLYIVEMPVVVDSYGVAKWKNITGKTDESEIKAEIHSFLGEFAELFTSLQKLGDQLEIKFVVTDILFYKGKLLSSYTIHGQVALNEFQDWLKKVYKKKYDIAFLYTGAEITGWKNRTATQGYANIGSVCKENAVFLQEVTGEYTDIIAAAHEAGHVLGANHDGHKLARECADKPIATTIMAASVTGRSIKHFYFSKCSYEAIMSNVKSGQGECLRDNYLSNVIKSDRRPGTFLSADDVCRRAVAPWSYVNRAKHHEKSYGDSMCVILYCKDGRKGKVAYTRQATSQGLACGKNKQCIRGKCIKTANGNPLVSDSCPLGDQPTIDYNGKKCSDLTSSECSRFKVQCCKSCM